ncbi:MAG: hypothetical protein DMF23_08605 [Verrucomicrobia bacterium]|nr:MAG: hypothetical protein DMF23_08605 [Verrucomicrobiota bacterium]
MIERACFRRAHRITSGKPGPPRASGWERELICGRRGGLSKPFISFHASKCEKLIAPIYRHRIAESHRGQQAPIAVL